MKIKCETILIVQKIPVFFIGYDSSRTSALIQINQNLYNLAVRRWVQNNRRISRWAQASTRRNESHIVNKIALIHVLERGEALVVVFERHLSRIFKNCAP